jgi:NADPH2:quinone reductase
MRAIRVTKFGGPEELVPSEVPEPVAGRGQVVIAVSVVDTLFVETQIRAGHAPWFDVTPPYTPGWAVVGEVISAGAGVDAEWVGRRVAARTSAGGGLAERAVSDIDTLVPVPDTVSSTVATALLHDGPTGLGLLDLADVRPTDRVLITAAAGGMGTLLVRLLHAAGAMVIGAARGKAKLDLVTELGADAVVDYTEPGWVEQVREATGGHGVDVVFDGAGGTVGEDAFSLAADGARVFHYGAPSGGFASVDQDEVRRRGLTVRGIEAVQFPPEQIKRLTERVLAEAAAGRVEPVIGRTFSLEQAADAHAAIAGREVLGKALVLVNPT